jgi:hypothetical protein
MMIRHLVQRLSSWPVGMHHCAAFRQCFLAAALIGLTGQVLYDRHLVTIVSLFPQWLLLGAIWYSWRQNAVAQEYWVRGTLIFALLIPALSCLGLLIAWLGWKANPMAIGGVVPISDSAGHYVSAQTFLREALLDTEGQRRPLNTVMTSLWLYLSGDDFELLLLIQALGFSVAAFLASAVVAALHGFRAGLLLFAFLLVFAEPYLPTTLTETNGIIFGILALVGFLFGLYRGSLAFFCLGALFLAMGLAIRPSALFVLPCVVVAGALIFGAGRIKRLMVVACLVSAILIPSGISSLLNRTMSHHDGALNANLSYVVYGLVAGGKGWEQYGKDHPLALKGLPEVKQSQVILQASRRHFMEHPADLVLGLVKGQVLGPLQTFAQMVRLGFLGAAGDTLRIIPPAAIIIVSLWFAGVLWCQMASRTQVFTNRNFRVFCILFLTGYLGSIPFFYKDGGLRLHAAVLPVISYLLVWALLPPRTAAEHSLSSGNAGRIPAGTVAFGLVLLGALGWISLIHPHNRKFETIPPAQQVKENEMMFVFKPGWPQCDLTKFEHVRSDDRPRWFSGPIPDDDYRSAGIREIAGQGHLYFGFDAGAREWKIIHTDQPVGLLSEVEIEHGDDIHRDKPYRDYYSVKSVRVIGAQSNPSARTPPPERIAD